MCYYRLILLFLFSFLLLNDTKAQQNLNYSFRHISQQDGLLHNEVFSIAQDAKGFIWITGANGLQRYDGLNFIYYPDMLSNPVEGLAANAYMYADKANNLLWINNDVSIEKMDLSKNKFTVYNHNDLPKDPSFGFSSYTGVNNDRWLLGRNAVYYQGNKNSGYFLSVFPPGTHKGSYMVTDSADNNTWLVTGPEIFLFSKENKTVYSEDFNPGLHPLLQSASYKTKEKNLRFIMIDSRQNIWVTTWSDKLYKFDAATEKISMYSLSAIKASQVGNKTPAAGLLVNCILEDDNHIVWVGTENAGLLRYNAEEDNFDYCIAQEKNRESIRYDYKIFSLFQDKEQNIWVGTDEGISIFNPYRQYFKSIRHQESNPLSIRKSEIISFAQLSNGDCYIGTWGEGIAVYDSGFQFKKNILFPGPSDKNKVWSLQQVDDETLWIGSQHGYLLIYNTITGATQTLHPPEMENSTIRCMQKDKSGNILFGLHSGKIVKWDKQLHKFLACRDSARQAGVVISILIDKAQHCWVSTTTGFKEFDMENMLYRSTWLPDKNKQYSISGKNCQGMEEYDDSTLLIGTVHGGLNFFNKKTKAFTHLTSTDGLLSNTVYAIKKNTDGYIWFTTDYGLSKFNAANKKIIRYSIDPGLINSSLHSNRLYPLQGGQWLTFSTTEAISFFPNKTGYPENQQSTIEITGFKLFDKHLFIDSLLSENKPVRLSYKENFFRVEFAALNFSNLQQINYYYRLSGIDKDWVNGGSARFANYTGLQPGEYVFNVKAVDGDSAEKVTSFRIIITPPFWKTWWFIAAVAFCILVFIGSLVRWRGKNIKMIEAEKLKVQHVKLQALRSQMNPHFIFNCINSIDGLIQSNDKYHATVYLNKFAKLLRNILDSSKQNTVTLSKDLETLKLYIELEQLRNENKFTAEIKAGDMLLQDDYKVPPLIIQPFVENAILHGIRYRQGNDGKLTISVHKQGDFLEYIIEDNGVGRDAFNSTKQKEKKSYGIDMSNERVKLFNNEENASVEITDLFENDKPAGTKVVILLKIK